MLTQPQHDAVVKVLVALTNADADDLAVLCGVPGKEAQEMRGFLKGALDRLYRNALPSAERAFKISADEREYASDGAVDEVSADMAGFDLIMGYLTGSASKVSTAVNTARQEAARLRRLFEAERESRQEAKAGR